MIEVRRFYFSTFCECDMLIHHTKCFSGVLRLKPLEVQSGVLGQDGPGQLVRTSVNISATQRRLWHNVNINVSSHSVDFSVFLKCFKFCPYIMNCTFSTCVHLFTFMLHAGSLNRLRTWEQRRGGETVDTEEEAHRQLVSIILADKNLNF